MEVEQTFTRNREGSGLGLSMVKFFVEMHGGTLTLVSEYGKGSEFIIELPVTSLENEEEIVRFRMWKGSKELSFQTYMFIISDGIIGS